MAFHFVSSVHSPPHDSRYRGALKENDRMLVPAVYLDSASSYGVVMRFLFLIMRGLYDAVAHLGSSLGLGGGLCGGLLLIAALKKPLCGNQGSLQKDVQQALCAITLRQWALTS